MRLKTRFAVLAVAALLTLPAPAQMQVVVSAPRGEPITLTFKPGGGRLSSITGRPYSATETLEQSLPNGTHIVMASTQISRDSVGRMRTERTEWIPQSPTGFPVIEITDPVAGYRYVLDPPHQTAHRLAVSIPVSAAPKTPRPCQMGRPTASNMHDGITAIHESLGSRMIEGVSACGDRTTMTYPAGSMFGNDRPLSLVSETWAAWDELGTIVLGTHAEPRGGTTTGGLKNVRLGEPDAALFRPPAGYHIVDETTEFAITVARPSGPSPKPAPEVTALTGMPYSAEEVLATDNTLADGTRLKHTISSTLIYRDLVGRTRKERVFEDGGTFRVFRVEIVDAAAGCRYVLDVDQKTARRSPVQVQLAPAREASIPSHPVQRLSTEWLGTQTIDGMITYGERNTTTFGPGSMSANDRPIVYLNERWTSPQLGIAMLSKLSNPRGGNSIATIKSLKFGEPDAALFRVPEGYRIVDDPVPTP